MLLKKNKKNTRLSNQVIASEDWKGMREDFKMFSEVVGYRLDYTPRSASIMRIFLSPGQVLHKKMSKFRFINAPVVTERRKTDEQVKTKKSSFFIIFRPATVMPKTYFTFLYFFYIKLTRSPQVYSDCRVKVHFICRTTPLLIAGV